MPWGNIFVNPASLTQTFGIIGPCGTLDQVLNQVLGPDPAACDQQTGPLPGTGSERGAGRRAPNAERLVVDHDAEPPRAGTSSLDQAVVARRRRAPAGPNSGLGGLSQLLSPLLQGKK